MTLFFTLEFQMKNLLIRMQNHWGTLSGTSEGEILKDYANNSRNLTLLFTSKYVIKYINI